MTGWFGERPPGRSARTVVVLALLAVLLIAAVPVALVVGVVLMALGHVVGGLALFGGSVLAATVTVALAGASGTRHLRKLLSRGSFGFERLDGGPYADAAEAPGSGYDDVVRLDRSEYTEVR